MKTLKRDSKNDEKVFEVCNWFLAHQEMTHKKLQKLLFLTYGYYLATYNRSNYALCDEIFKNDFEAWVHGPVIAFIYEYYKSSGYKLISVNKNQICNKNISSKEEKILNFVYEEYKFKDGDDLEKITHNQDPWKNARKGLNDIVPSSNKISKKDIYTYFKKQKMIVGN